MMSAAAHPEPEELWGDLFHGCAWAAYVELAAATGGPPPAEEIRRLAYRMYEEEVARKNATRTTRLTTD
jgi:hypothetical protein